MNEASALKQPDEAEAIRIDRFGSGFRILAIALATYAASAVVVSSSAALFVLAVQAAVRQDPITGSFNLAGGIAILIGLALALVSFILLVWAVSRITRETRSATPETNRAVVRMRRGLKIAYIFLVPIGLLTLAAGFMRGGQALLPVAIGAATVAAFAFLTSLVLAAVALGGKSWTGMTWSAAIAGSIGILGEAVASMRTLGAPGAPVDSVTYWVVFGGFPLVNWNVPFGLMVAASSILLAYVFWGLAADFTRGLSPGHGAPSLGSSP